MITLLLDLDDTLLENPMDTFLPPYLKGLAKRIAPFVEAERMVKTLLDATAKMTRNQNPNINLEQVFDQAFYPPLGISKAQLADTLQRYYTEDFPQLQAFTRPKPGAVEMVAEAIQRGYRIGIATNPLFPRTAIQQRIAWAGLDKFPFALIPSYENFHFAKPNPAYLTEFLAQMGWPDGPVVLVGDDLENDLPAAQGAGIAMYWINDGQNTPHENGPQSGGPIHHLLDWIGSQSWEDIHPDFSSSSAMLAVLRATPAALASLTKPLSDNDWQRTSLSGHGEWSLTEIICHLTDTEAEVNLPRVQKVLQKQAPFLAGIDTDAWVSQRGYAAQNGRQALGRFIQTRMDLLDALAGQPPQAWQRTAQHAIFGPTSLQELVGIICKHDQLHIQQAWQAIH